MKILFLSRKDSIFVKELIENLIIKYNFEIELIDIFHFEHIWFTKKKIKKISFYPKKFPQNLYLKYLLSIPCSYIYIKKLNKTYDYIHMFYKKFQYYFLINLLKNKSKKIYLSIFGSDFYKNPIKIFDKPFYKYTNLITFTNKETQLQFNYLYNQTLTQKTILCPFGQTNHDFIDKIKKNESKDKSKKILDIPKNKIVICCGSNGYPNEQHEQIINQLSKIKNKSKITLVFPITYGATSQRINKIKEMVKTKLIDFKTIIIDQYLSSEDLARLRICTDILINVRKTDQISGAMLESIYAGSTIITGSWLPYKSLDQAHVNLQKISKISNLQKKLLYCINNNVGLKKQNKKNHTYIGTTYNWNSALPKWNKMYNFQST